MTPSRIAAVALAALILGLPACQKHAEESAHKDHQKIVVTTPKVQDVVVVQPYVCQIHARRNTDIKSLQDGYLETISITEGQQVKAGDVLFKVNPVLFNARLDADMAEAQAAQVKFDATYKLYTDKVVSVVEVNQSRAELARANARVELARRELGFTTMSAPFDGLIDRFRLQQGSLVKKEDILTVLSDNSLLWVYFNVPEARYFEFKEREGATADPSRLRLVDSRVELMLADGNKFKHEASSNVMTIPSQFNNETGNIPFRADFPNPERLLRHGQTGTVRIHRTVRGALVIPQRATFEFLDKRYVYVVGADKVVRQRLITIQDEQDDIFVIKSGLDVHDQIVLEGIKQVTNEQKLDQFTEKSVDEVLKNQKRDAE